jgi:hypothetical protein
LITDITGQTVVVAWPEAVIPDPTVVIPDPTVVIPDPTVVIPGLIRDPVSLFKLNWS